MTDQQSNKESFRAEQAVVKRKRGISFIWILPIIAALIGAWLIYKGIVDAPIEVVINFPSAEGMEEGKTKVIFKGLTAGVVESFKMHPDLESVDVTIEFDQRAKPVLLDTTEFWLVKPRVSMEGVTGLGTMLGGDYIAMRASIGDGKPARKFKALAEPPPLPEDEPGLHLTLLSKSLDVGHGSPVLYKSFEVGSVQTYKLSDKSQEMEIKIFIKPEYSYLVNKHTRFWNAGGISVSGGLTGLKIRTESLAAILGGGVTFYTPRDKRKAPAVKNGHRFTLYDDYESAHEKDAPVPGLAPEPGLKILLTSNQLGSIKEGNKVYYREIEVGQVTGYELAATADQVLIHVEIQKRYAPLVRENSVFWNASGISVHAGLFSGVQIDTESLKAILEGGIAFATPDNEDMGKQAKQNAIFPLRANPEDDWLEWKPRIELAK